MPLIRRVLKYYYGKRQKISDAYLYKTLFLIWHNYYSTGATFMYCDVVAAFNRMVEKLCVLFT